MALPSPSNPSACVHCGKALAPATPFCAQCQRIQPFPDSPPHYFEVFGLAPSLQVDEDALRKRFYEISQKVHPDRFALAGDRDAIHAGRWTTLLNRAYQTLRDRGDRSDYLLTLTGASPEAAKQVPLDLAEAYFELQDLLAESGGIEPMKEFRKNLIELESENETEWSQLAKEWQTTPDPSKLLPRLQSQLNKQRYLRAMLLDLDRKLESA